MYVVSTVFAVLANRLRQPNGQLVAASPTPLSAASPAQSRTAPLDPPSEELDRYRLHVVAPSVAEAVASAGGLIYDRAMAGWDVTVMVDGEVDDRPIRILGAKAENLSAALASRGEAGRPRALAVATDVVAGSEAVRRNLIAACNAPTIDILLWGGHCPSELQCDITPVGHQPSVAANVFKAHALAAVGTDTPVGMDAEGFFSLT
jgi:hypothetical protein